jgi:hypothetical protein
VQFEIGNKQLWDAILAKASQDNSKIAQLLDYVDVYEQPSKFIMAYDDDMEIGEVRQPLMETFKRIEVYKYLIKSAVNAGEREKQEACKELLKINSAGFRNIHNKCDAC